MSTLAITAFFAVGRRISLDVKILRCGACVYKLQIEEYSIDKFLHEWESSVEDFLIALLTHSPPASVMELLEVARQASGPDIFFKISDLVLAINAKW